MKTWSLRSNGITRQANIIWTKLGRKCQNSNPKFWVIFKFHFFYFVKCLKKLGEVWFQKHFFMRSFLNVIFSRFFFFCFFFAKMEGGVCVCIHWWDVSFALVAAAVETRFLRLGWGCGRFFRSFPTSISVIRLGKWHQLLRALYSQFPHQQVLWQHESPIFFSLQAPKPELLEGKEPRIPKLQKSNLFG